MKDRRKVAFVTAAGVLLIAAAFGLAAVVAQKGGPADEPPVQAAPSEVSSGGLAAADEDGDGTVYQSGMHPWIVRDEPGVCPICGMDLVAVQVDRVDDGAVKIDPVTLQNIGVRTAPVATESIVRELRTTGRFEMDEQGAHEVSLKVSGWVEKLHVDFDGAMVRRGAPLLDLYSPELVSTQEEYLLALRNLNRLEGGPAADDARRLLEAARRRLSYWDLSEEQIRHLETSSEPQRTIRFTVPASGEVMNKQVAEGQYVEAGRSLMSIVDVSRVWLMVDVYEQDLGWVRPGTGALIELPYEPGRTYRGTVDHIYNMLETETRTAKARITLSAGENTPFKPGMYATVRLTGGETGPVTTVPDEAVLRSGEGEVVILALGEGRFMPAEVVTGIQSNGRTQIVQGLSGDERVVTSAQFLIDSEARLRSAVGAMVGEHDHGQISASTGGGT